MIKREPCECSCDRCKKMCNVPCMGTFEEIKAISDFGFPKRLMFIKYPFKTKYINILIPAHQGEEGRYTIVGLNTPCTFQNKNGLCQLHDLGLKPTEGKIAIHGKHNPRNTRTNLAKTWLSAKAEEFVWNWIQDYCSNISEAMERAIYD